MKIIGTILISLAAGVAILIGVGFGFTIYLSYIGARVPVYQTEISDFEFQQVSMNDKEYAAHVTSELNKLTEAHGIKKLKCFIFLRKPQPDSLSDNYVRKSPKGGRFIRIYY